ncbi:MAG: hypothetical protein WC426_14250, partial [Sulfuriferula sp.]
MANEELTLKVGADLTDAEAKFKRLENKVTALGSNLEKAGSGLKELAGIAGFAVGIDAAVEGFKALVEQADQMGKSSRRMGIDVQAYQELGYMAGQAGASIDDLAGSFTKMKKCIGDASLEEEKAVISLGKIGLKVNDLKGLKPDAQFAKIAEALRDVSSEEERTTLAMDILGKSADKLMPLIANFEDLKSEAKSVTMVFQQDAVDAAEKLSDSMERLGMSFTSIVANSGLIEYLAGAAEGLEELMGKTQKLLDMQGKGKTSGSYADGTNDKLMSGIRFAADYVTFGYGGDWLDSARAGVQGQGDSVLNIDGDSNAEILADRKRKKQEEQRKKDEAAQREQVKKETATLKERNALEKKSSEVFVAWRGKTQDDSDVAIAKNSAQGKGGDDAASLAVARLALEQSMGRSLNSEELEQFNILQKESIELEKQAKIKAWKDNKLDSLNAEVEAEALKTQGLERQAELLKEQAAYKKQFGTEMDKADADKLDSLLGQKQSLKQAEETK